MDSILWLKFKFQVHIETFNFRTIPAELTWNSCTKNTLKLCIIDRTAKIPSRITRVKFQSKAEKQSTLNVYEIQQL